LESDAENVELPQNPHEVTAELSSQDTQAESASGAGLPTPTTTASNLAASTPKASPTSKPALIDRDHARSETPSTQDVPSEATIDTTPTTPSSVQPSTTPAASNVTPTKSSKPAVPRTAVPIIPLIPALPKAKAAPKEAKSSPISQPADSDEQEKAAEDVTGPAVAAPTEAQQPVNEEPPQENAQPTSAPPPVKVAHKSWASMVGKHASPAGSVAAAGRAGPNGPAAGGANVSDAGASSFAKSNASSVAEVLQAYRVNGVDNLAFVEPRGLINTGNMCYMNSVSNQLAVVPDTN
jgi:ubiquitin carboxyl-terminal hydrolase 10